MEWEAGYALHLLPTPACLEAGKRRYTDPCYPPEECGDEDLGRVNRVLSAAQSKLLYTYDLGDCWRHEIVLEKVPDEEIGPPVCVDGRGDNPIEDYCPDYPEDPVPFDRDAINKELAERGAWKTSAHDHDDD
ncbi:hypothetical protein AB0F17_21440 [Nonomuraea sp. NPDC026600]|uniref:IS1096 element passenger TnpR family protein n=1 Tax=Nonomuraea sp. NPDC026600 TaxID=3155363 RepID=UPI0033E39050